MTERQFAFIYQALVNEPDDIVGLIAYGVYKRRKVDHIRAFCDEHGRNPGDDDLGPFHSACSFHVDSYRMEAEQILQDAIQLVLEEHLSDLDQQYEKKLLNKLRTSFWSNVGSGIVAAVLSAAIIGLIVLGTLGFRIDYSTRQVANENSGIPSNIVTISPGCIEQIRPGNATRGETVTISPGGNAAHTTP